MARFEENNHEERALIPNVMLPIPRNSIKITEIDRKKVIHALIMNNRDKQQSSSREEPPYTMYFCDQDKTISNDG